MRIHLVYAFSPDDPAIQAPQSITHYLYYFLKQRAEVLYYDWSSPHVPGPDPGAIFIGHPHYDPNTIVQRVFRENVPFKAKCTIHPLHHGRPEDNLPFDGLARQADKIFSIMGPYWYDTLEQSPFAHWKPKIVRLDMAVDSTIFPYVKTQFNLVGHRRLVYMGSTMPQKNVGYLRQIMLALPTVQLHWYGGSSDHPLARLPNVKTFGWMRLDQNVAKQIAANCDIFISTSISDANPTTILESAAWGLIPIATKESGYWPNAGPDQLRVAEIKLNDLNQSINNIKELLLAPSEQLMDRSLINRRLIESYYNWDRFCNVVWHELQKLDPPIGMI